MPLFQGFDETAHYIHTSWIADNRRLPNFLLEQPSYEAQQAPAYYIVGALLIAPIDRSDWAQQFRVQPTLYPSLEFPDYIRDGMSWSTTGTLAAGRVLRIFSTVLGMLMLGCTFEFVRRLVRPLTSQDRSVGFATLATASICFMPRVLKMSASINNDIAVAAAGAGFLLVSLIIVQATKPSRRAFFMAGLLLGLAIACKQNGFGLGLVAAYLAAHTITRLRRGRLTAGQLVGLSVCALAGFALLGGSYLVLNTVRYGDPLGWSAAVRVVHGETRRATAQTLWEFIDSLPYVIATFWGGKGHEFPFDGQINEIHFAIAACIVLGLLIALVRLALHSNARRLFGQHRAEIGLVFIAIVAGLMVNVYWTINFIYPNLRYFSPEFPALACAIALGFLAFLPSRWHGAMCGGLGAALLAFAVYVPFVFTYPASRNIDPASEAERAQLVAAHSRPILFDNGIEFLGATLPQNRITLGQPISLTLFWRLAREVKTPQILNIDVRNEHNEWLGRFSTVDVRSRQYAPQVWPVNQTLRQDYSIPLPQRSMTQTLATLTIGWYDAGKPYTISAPIDMNGVSLPVGRVKLLGAQTPLQLPLVSTTATFDAKLRLDGYMRERDQLTLKWTTLATLPRPVTVFVHGVDSSGALRAQHDFLVSDDFALLDAGDSAINTVNIKGLAAVSEIRIGLYDPATGERWPLVGDNTSPEHFVTITKQK